MSVLSVDLGTSNTVAVLSAHGRQPRVVEVEGSAAMPSAVFAAEEGRLVVGREAERRARLDPARFEPNPKRRVDEGTLLLGDRVVPVTEAFAAVLGKVAGEVSRQLNGGRADEVRLTHPAQWGPVRRNVVLSAARQAGLGSNLVLVPEPVAAAAHFASFPGRSLAPGQALAVYDLGAGTFDVAIVVAGPAGFTVLAEAGLPDLGGLDVDQSLLAHVGHQVSAQDPAGWQRLLRPQSTADRRARRALQEDVRAAKEALSVHPQTEVPLPEPFHDALVTRAELEALIRPNLLRSVELLSATVRSAGLTQDRLAGVYLVGGSSRIPLVATLIAEQLRIVATNLDQPETAVALGAHHVAREAVSLRTDGLPPADEERTIHLSSPPRPAPKPAPRLVPAPVLAAPQRPAYPPPPRPGYQRPEQKPNRTPLIVGLVAVLAVAGIVAGILASNSSEPPGVAVANPKSVPDDMSCDSIVPLNVVSELFGVDAQEFDSNERCNWAARDSAEDRASAALSVDTWYTTEPVEYQLNGHDARREGDNGSCSVEVAIQTDKAIAARAMNDRGGSCEIAEALLTTALDNLPDA